MKDLRAKIQGYQDQFDKAINQIKDQHSLTELRNLFFSRKKGYVTLLLKEIQGLAPQEKREAGLLINSLKDHIQGKIQDLQKEIGAPLSIHHAAGTNG